MNRASVCRLLMCVLAFAAVPGFAQVQGKPALDPAKLTEAQIRGVEVPDALYHLIAIYRRSGDIQHLAWSLERLTHFLPDSGEVKLDLAATFAAMGDKTRTYDTLLRMQGQGYGYDLSNDSRFRKVSDTKVWQYAVANLKVNLKPFGQGRVAFDLPKGDHLFESLAWDAKRQKFLVGSVREGKVYLAGKDGKLENFISPTAENGLWSVYALAVDPARDLLYVASTASLYFKGYKPADVGRAGVFKFSLSSGKLLGRYLLPADGGRMSTLSSIVVAKNGRVYAADGLANRIYKLDDGKLELMLENPQLTSLRGLAVSDDGKNLYFADYNLGLFGVDLSAGKGFDLKYNPANLVLGGIDGLYWYDGCLIAIQSGMTPERVMRLTMSADGRSVVKVMPLEANNPVLTLPTYGTVVGKDLYFIANSQRNFYGKYGDPTDAGKLQPVHVFENDLRFAWNEPGRNTGVTPLPTATPAQAKKLLEERPKKPGG